MLSVLTFLVLHILGAKQRIFNTIVRHTLPFLCYKTISEYFCENRITLSLTVGALNFVQFFSGTPCMSLLIESKKTMSA